MAKQPKTPAPSQTTAQVEDTSSASTAVLDTPEVQAAVAQIAADESASESESAPVSETPAQENVVPPSWRDLAKEHGLDLSAHEDDQSAVKYLSEQLTAAEQARREAESARQLAQYGQEVLPYASEFQTFLEQRRGQKQESAPDPYARPEYDPRWEAMVQYDDAGVIVPNPKAGGTPEIARKVQEHIAWQRGFIREPEKYLERFVDQRAEQRAKALVEKQLSEFRAQIAAEQFIVTNDKWLWDRDDKGEYVMVKDQAGRAQRKLSEEGQFYAQKLSEAEAQGFDSRGQEWYANQAIGLYRQFKKQNTPAKTSEPPKTAADVKNDFLKTAAAHGAQPSASAAPPLRSTDDVQNSNKRLNEQLAEALKASGYDSSTLIS